jgi:hypothetical protein
MGNEPKTQLFLVYIVMHHFSCAQKHLKGRDQRESRWALKLANDMYAASDRGDRCPFDFEFYFYDSTIVLTVGREVSKKIKKYILFFTHFNLIVHCTFYAILRGINPFISNTPSKPLISSGSA